MDTELVVLHFDTAEAAGRALSTVYTLEAEGFIELDDAAILTRGDDGRVTAERGAQAEAPRNVAFGGALGLVVGGLMGLPVLGLAAGAGAAVKRSRHAKLLDELVSSVGNDMTPGSGVVALSVVELRDPEMVTDRLEVHQDSLLRAEIPAALRAEIERHSSD